MLDVLEGSTREKRLTNRYKRAIDYKIKWCMKPVDITNTKHVIRGLIGNSKPRIKITVTLKRIRITKKRKANYRISIFNTTKL